MSAFEWMRALHIISMIAWMAGLLMYPRLLIYRLEGVGNQGLEAAMDNAARRLNKIILLPSMLLTWFFGLGLLGHNWEFYSVQIWFWVKFAFVFGLTGVHGVMTATGKKVSAGETPVSAKKLRLFNEIPMVIAIVVVIMAVVQPF